MTVTTRSGLILSLLAAVLTVCVATKPTTKPEIGPKKILVILPVGSQSHHIVYSSLYNELLERGHSVTAISGRAQKIKHPRLREIVVQDPFQSFLHNLTRAHFNGPMSAATEVMSMILKTGPLLFSETVFACPEAMALKSEKFDLLISEAYFFQEPLLAFGHHFGCPTMVLNPVGYTNHLNYNSGSAVNPAYVPFFFTPGVNPENFLDRLTNTIITTGAIFLYHTFYLYKANARMLDVFPQAPPIQELIKNVSLALLNNNNALVDPVPLAPSVIEVAGLQIKPGKPLPDEMKRWIEDSKDGFVYFSLGSILKSDLLPQETQDAIFRSFGKLQQRVLVKWDSEVPANAPKNCRFEKWVPQQGVLAHPNLKVFVSHGGLLSTQESLYFGAAMIAMPVFGDHHMNVAMSTKKGFSIKVAIGDLTTEKLDAALKEVIYNPKYRERSKELSAVFRLDPTPPLEKAVYYTEQLMKLGSFKHLQPSSINLHWYQYLLLDVIVVLLLALFVSWKIIRFVCRTCLGSCSKSPMKKKKRD